MISIILAISYEGINAIRTQGPKVLKTFQVNNEKTKIFLKLFQNFLLYFEIYYNLHLINVKKEIVLKKAGSFGTLLYCGLKLYLTIKLKVSLVHT